MNSARAAAIPGGAARCRRGRDGPVESDVARCRA